MPHAISSISYDPDHALFLARAKALATESTSKQSLPDNFPTEVQSAMVWHRGSFESDEWVISLTAIYLAEIDSAMRAFQGLRIPMGFISPETFPLPTLGPFIRDIIANDVYDGKGFAVLRGIPVQNYSNQENTIIHAGLASWLGRLRGRQDKEGNLVVRHIKDVTDAEAALSIGTAQYTSDPQAFHTDFGDIVSLYCIDTSASGGTSRLASLGQIYNELCKCRPDVIGVLAGDWPFATFDTHAFTQRPALFYHCGRLMMQYSRRLFTGFGEFRNSEVSKALTVAHMDAMDNLEFLARRNSISMNLQKGDIQWVNNLGILHSRDAFQDNHLHRRELQRMWVRNEELTWDLPKELNGLWNRIFYSTDLHWQEFVPIEARIKLRGLEHELEKSNKNPQDNEWVRVHRVPEPDTVLKGESESESTKLQGQEWAHSLEGPEWLSRDMANSQTDNVTGDEGNRAMKGEEWFAGLRGTEWTSLLQGRELTAESKPHKLAKHLKRDEWCAKLVGSEWAENLPVWEAVGDLQGSEWMAKSRQKKSTANLEGNEWAGEMKGSEWVENSEGSDGVSALKGTEGMCALKGEEWTAEKLETLQG